LYCFRTLAVVIGYSVMICEVFQTLLILRLVSTSFLQLCPFIVYQGTKGLGCLLYLSNNIECMIKSSCLLAGQRQWQTIVGIRKTGYKNLHAKFSPCFPIDVRLKAACKSYKLIARGMFPIPKRFALLGDGLRKSRANWLYTIMIATSGFYIPPKDHSPVYAYLFQFLWCNTPVYP